jgi:hypothetical protein
MASPLYVLGYHRVLEEQGDDPFGITLRRSTFQEHLDLLSRVGAILGEDRSGQVLTGLALDWDLVREIQDCRWF